MTWSELKTSCIRKIPVLVRWPDKRREHSFILDFFVSFCIKAKRKEKEIIKSESF
jgi:hypothetical protein